MPSSSASCLLQERNFSYDIELRWLEKILRSSWGWHCTVPPSLVLRFRAAPSTVHCCDGATCSNIRCWIILLSWHIFWVRSSHVTKINDIRVREALSWSCSWSQYFEWNHEGKSDSCCYEQLSRAPARESATRLDATCSPKHFDNRDTTLSISTTHILLMLSSSDWTFTNDMIHHRYP